MDWNDYQIKFLNSYFCDLKLLKVREGPIEKWEDTIYGIKIEIAIRIITTNRVCKRLDEVSLEEFLRSWKTEFKIVNNEICKLKNLSNFQED